VGFDGVRPFGGYVSARESYKFEAGATFRDTEFEGGFHTVDDADLEAASFR